MTRQKIISPFKAKGRRRCRPLSFKVVAEGRVAVTLEEAALEEVGGRARVIPSAETTLSPPLYLILKRMLLRNWNNVGWAIKTAFKNQGRESFGHSRSNLC